MLDSKNAPFAGIIRKQQSKIYPGRLIPRNLNTRSVGASRAECFTMSDSHQPNALSVRAITNKDSHDQLVKECTSHNKPTVLHVFNSSIPRCQTSLSTFESWAATSSPEHDDKIQFAKMNYTSETSFMFKFAPNQLPITVLMVGQGWARTVTGTDIREVARVAGEMMDEHGRLMSGH